jgi:6-phosphogluconolactonase
MANRSVWLSVLVLAGLAATMGCGGGSPKKVPPPSKPEFLYSIATSGTPPKVSFELLSFTLDPSTGTVSAPASLALSEPTDGLAVRPDAKFLYVSDPDPLTPAIDIYSIDSKTGALAAAGAFPVTTICPFCQVQSAPGVLAMNASGTSLYYASATLGAGVAEGIGALTTDASSGALSLVKDSPFPDNQAPLFVRVHPSGQFLYTEDINAPSPNGFALVSVSGYSIDSSTGALAPVAGSPFAPTAKAEAMGFAIHPSGKFLYASTGSAANGILAWSVDATTGALTPMTGAPFLPGATTYSATFDQAGKFLYVSAGANLGILGFSVDAGTGALTPMSGSPFFTASFLGPLVVDPTGKWLIAGNGKDQAINVFSLDATTGMPTQLVSTTPAGALPGWLTIVQGP